MARFEMTIDDVVETAKGIVVCGKASSGEIRAGDVLALHTDRAVFHVKVRFLEGFHNVGPQFRRAGEYVAAGIAGVSKLDVRSGSRLVGGE